MKREAVKTIKSLRILGLLGATLVISPTAVGQQPNLSWMLCHDAPDFECARLPVPLDWNNPQGEKIELSLIRQPASVNAAPTLLLGEGGPGVSGVEQMKSGGWARSLDRLKLKGLVNAVSWDSRGIGESSPLICDPERPPTSVYNQESVTDEQLAAVIEQNRAHIEGCRETSGAIVDHVDTLSDVRDMEAIRVALELDKLNYLGVSYGSVRGQQYVDKYPQNSGRFVLDSVFDHSVKGLKAYAELVVQESERRTQFFLEWCAAHTGCALHDADVDALLADLYNKAEKGELTDPATQQPVTVWDIAAEVHSDVVGPAVGSFERFANYLAHLAGHLPNGNASLAMPKVAEKKHPFNYDTIFDAITCSDWGAGVNTAKEIRDIWAGLPQVAPRTKALMLFMPTPVKCVGRPLPANPPTPISFAGAPQVMIVAALGDQQTAYDWAFSLAKKTRTPLLTYGGYKHITYLESACTASHIRHYLLEGVQLKADTYCPAEAFYPNEFYLQPGEVRADISTMSLTEARAGALVVYNKTSLELPPGKNRFVVRMGLNNGAIGSYTDTSADRGELKVKTNLYQGPGIYKIVLAATDGSATAQGNVDVGPPIYVTVTPDP